MEIPKLTKDEGVTLVFLFSVQLTPAAWRGWRQSWRLSGAWSTRQERNQARRGKGPRPCGGEGRCLEKAV